MKNPYQLLLIATRKLIAKKILHNLEIPERIFDANIANNIIFNALLNDKPCMISRFGSTEINTVASYIGYKYNKGDAIGYILGKNPDWWKFNTEDLKDMQFNSGFFPLQLNMLEKFARLILNDTLEIDILGSWRYEEKFLNKYFNPNLKSIALLLLEPFWADEPWSYALKGKNVLVIHPFSELITSQYSHREHLFNNKKILPNFNLKTIKAVQSIENCHNFDSWFSALEYMKNQMDKIDYDICLIGAGAYGMPLAAHAKRKGKKAVHLGGSLQLLFGIRGKRWDNPNYGIATLGESGKYQNLFNDYWIYPGDEYKPKNAHCCDDNCYWK